jgi:hypothetical protein
MAIFKSDPMKTLQRDLDAARLNRDRLAAKLSESEMSAAARRGEAQQLAYDNAEGSALARAQTALQAALGDVSIFGGALTKASAFLRTVETQYAELIDKKTRNQTAAEVAAMATDLENAAKKFDTAVAELAEIAGRAAMFCPDAHGLAAFATSSRVQVPPATQLTATVMRDYAAAVLRGEGRATLLKPDEAVVMPAPAPKPVTVRLFALKPVKWTDAAGMQRFIHKYNDVDLPETAAAIALGKGICAELTDPRRKQLKGLSPGHPQPSWCADLDDETETTLGEEKSRPVEQQVVHSAFQQQLPPGFEPLDRGKGFVIKVPAGNPTPGEGEAA